MDTRHICLVAGTIIILISESSAGNANRETGCIISDVDAAFECLGVPKLYRHDLDYSKVAQQVCRENKSKEVEDCIDNLHSNNDCQNDEFFQFLVQIDRFLEYIDFFCSHSEVYVDNGLCIAQAYTAALNCSADAMEEIDAMTDPDDEGMTLAEVMAIFCRPMLVIASCHTNTVAESCGGKAATFADTNWQFEMHYCYTATTSTSISIQLGTTTQLHILGSVTQWSSTGQESFNGKSEIRQSVGLLILLYMCISIFEYNVIN